MFRTKLAVSAVMLTVAFAAPTYATDYITIGSSGTGGTYGIIASAMAKIINGESENIETNVEATPGGGRGNIRLLAQGKLDFGIATVADAMEAWNGAGEFEKASNLRTVLFGTTLPFHLVVPADSPVQSIADLKGKQIVTNSSANALTFVPDALAAYGLEEGDYQLTQYATTETIEVMKDGRADAFASFLFMPVSALTDLATSHDIRLIGMDADKIQEMAEEHGIYSADEIPGGTYPGQEDAVSTPSIAVAIYSHDEVSPDIVHTFTKAVVGNEAALAEIYKPAASFAADRQKRRIAQGEVLPPWHDGAESYLRETGLVE